MKTLLAEAAAFTLGFLGMIAGAVFTNEALGFLSRLARFLVERAVKKLPLTMQDERRAEYLATLEFEGQDGKRLSELKAALEAWHGASQTACILEASLEPDEQAEALMTRGSRYINVGILIFSFPMAILYFSEALNPDLYKDFLWPNLLFISAFAFSVVVLIKGHSYYQRLAKLKPDQE